MLGRPVRFVLVGIWNTVVGYAAFAACYAVVTSAGIHYLWATPLSHVLAIVNAYLWHRSLVFGTEAPVARSFFRFTLVYWILFAVNLALLPLLVEVGGIHPMPAQALVMALCGASAYAAHSRFSFSERSPDCGRASRDGSRFS